METYIINQITKDKKGTTIEVSLGDMGKLSVTNINRINFDLIDMASKPKTKVIINLNGIKFIDSTGFNCLNQLSNMAQERQSSIELTGVEPEVLELIHLVKRHNQFNIKTIVPMRVSENVA